MSNLTFGACIWAPRVHFVRGDYTIVEQENKYYVGLPMRHQTTGGFIPQTLVESHACDSFGEAMAALESKEQSKAAHCEQFNCE